MEWDTLKLLWNIALTLGGGLIAYFYNLVVKKIEKVEEKAEKTQEQLNSVRVQYVEKIEIQRIEQRIDARFLEMREFILQLLDRNTK